MVANTSLLGSALSATGPAPAPPARAFPSGQEAAHDAGLVRRSIAGDEDAFGEIFTRYRSKMFSIAFRCLRNHADAEEIAQDTFIRAHRSLAKFRGDSSLATWLYRITLNLSRNRHQHHIARRRHLTLSLDCAVSDENPATFSDWIASDAPSPVCEVTTAELSEQLIVCMRKLGSSHREILHRRTGLSESYAEIAFALGIRPGTVKSRIGRARQKLRELLAEAYPDVAVGASPYDCLEPARSRGFGRAVGA